MCPEYCLKHSLYWHNLPINQRYILSCQWRTVPKLTKPGHRELAVLQGHSGSTTTFQPDATVPLTLSGSSSQPGSGHHQHLTSTCHVVPTMLIFAGIHGDRSRKALLFFCWGFIFVLYLSSINTFFKWQISYKIIYLWLSWLTSKQNIQPQWVISHSLPSISQCYSLSLSVPQHLSLPCHPRPNFTFHHQPEFCVLCV